MPITRCRARRLSRFSILSARAAMPCAVMTGSRLRRDRDNPDLYRLTHPRLATRYAMNVGTIVEAPMLKVRLTRARKASSAGRPRPLTGGRVLGEMEEYFLTSLAPGDPFVFASETLKLEAVRDTEALVSARAMPMPKC